MPTIEDRIYGPEPLTVSTPQHEDPQPDPSVATQAPKPTVADLRPQPDPPADAGIAAQLAALRQYAASLPAPESHDERVRREKSERARRIIGAVSDGVRSLSNLYFTAKGAPSAYSPASSQYAAEDARIAKARADREANDRAWLNVALQAGQLQTQRSAMTRELEDRALALKRQQEQDELRRKADERAERKASDEHEKAQAYLDLQQGKIDEQQYRTAIAAIDAGDRHARNQAYISRQNRTTARVSRQGSGNEKWDRYIDVTPDGGGYVRVYDSELVDYYAHLPDDAKPQEFVRRDDDGNSVYGPKKNPSKAEMQNAVAEYMSRHGQIFEDDPSFTPPAPKPKDGSKPKTDSKPKGDAPQKKTGLSGKWK